MRLLVIRHGIAEDRDAWADAGRPDSERPMTQDGRRKMRRAAGGLARIEPALDVLASSPLARAMQTAELVAREYGRMEVTTVAELAPESTAEDLLPWLRSLDSEATVAVVGHEPHLSLLVGWLLTGRHESFVDLRKGGVVLLTFDDPPAGGNATLAWGLAPRHLRALRRT